MIDKAIDTRALARPLTAQEEIYWRLTYHDQIHHLVAAEIVGRTRISQWRTALNSLQRRHPLLQVAIEMPGKDNDYRQPFFVPQPYAIIPLRTEESSGDKGAMSAEIERELATPFLSGVAPLARAVLLHAPERSVVLLATSHSIGDGMSALLLLRDLLGFLSGHSLEALPMPATAEELLGLSPAVPDSAPLQPNKALTNAGRKPTVLLLSVPEGMTKKILVTARARGLTVHVAIIAAFVLAIRQLVPRFKTDPVRIISPVNTRAELGAGEALGMYFTSPQSSFEPNQAICFWEIAAEARADIAMSSSRQALLEATAAMQALTGPGLTNESAASTLQHGFAMDLLVSNLGRIQYDLEFGELFLERVWGPAVLAGEETQAVGVITTGDELCLTLTSRHPVPNLLETAVDVLSDQMAGS